MPLCHPCRIHAGFIRSFRIFQGAFLLGAGVVAAVSIAGCRPDAADASAQNASETIARGARSGLARTPSPWPIDEQTHQLRQFTKHAKDLEKNPTLAMITLFPDKMLPDADIAPIGVDTITIDELEELIAQGGWGILDVRKDADVRKTGVIPGAVHYMYSYEGAPAPAGVPMLTADVVRSLMVEHPKGLIIYCNGPKCSRSYNASLAIVQSWGFSSDRVRWFRDGAPAWRQSPLIPASTLSTDNAQSSLPTG